MDKSKLIHIFKTLTKPELKEFGKYLDGTSYRKTGGVFAMYNYLKKWHPDFPPNKIEKTTVHNVIFKNSSTFNRRFSDLMTNLSKALEDFLIKKRLEKNDNEREILLLEVLKERKLDRFFFQRVNTIEKNWDTTNIAGIDQLHYDYKLMQMLFLHPSYSVLNETPIGPQHLIEKIDKYYIAVKLYWILCYYNNKNNVITKEDDSNIEAEFQIQNLLKLSDSPKFKDTPQIKLLKQLLSDFMFENFINYNQVKDNFINNLSLYNEYEKHDLINLLISYCNERQKKGDKEAIKALFDLLKFVVEQRMVLEEGYIAAEQFRTIVTIGCKVKEIDWIEQFIDEIGEYLQEAEKNDTILLCKAQVLIHKKQFGEAIKLLAQIKLQNILYSVQTRSMQLICYYELDGYEDLFFNTGKSSTDYLKRNSQISDVTYKSFSNFISLARKLYICKTKENNCNKQLLEKEINETNNVYHKQWLLEKVQEQ